ncbi:IS1634 family transposase [Alkalilimnicola ehrlichii]|uniref:IS1634 family transposase n=1 Tax=Alkalilimnicola ehrlichii TaxID=351052 RepID=UPI003BA395F7
MYTRITKSGPRRYLQLVEGYRDDNGKVKQRVVASLGRIDQLEAADLEPLIHGLQRAVGRPESLPEAPRFDTARAFGDVWAMHQLWQELGLDEALKRALRSSRRQFDAEALIRAMVFNRLAAPSSKLGVLEWLREEASVPELDHATIHHKQLLHAMDALEEHKADVERAVAAQLRPLLDQELSVIFYDLTTVRIHGTATVDDDLRRHGLSKDTGGIGRQFALGVVQTTEGLPIAHEVFEGNVAETRTLAPMIERLLERFALKRVVVVADRGLLSFDNIDTLEALGAEQGLAVDYILAVPARRYIEFTELMERLHPELAAAVTDERVDVVTETTWQGRRLVVAHNAERAAEQTATRRATIEQLDALGEQLASRLDRQDAGEAGRGRPSTDRSAYQRFYKAVLDKNMRRFVKADLTSTRFSYTIDEEARAAAERLDGKLLLVTSLDDMAADAVVERYRSLADIERGFRVLKSEIEIAPVYHRLPERIRAHAMICFLALVLYRVLRGRLKAAGSPYSPEKMLKSLRQIQRHTVHVGSRSYEGLTRPSQEQLDLFEAAGVEVPKDPC